jgi:DNA (cytosine-5)-methyltransferase 1
MTTPLILSVFPGIDLLGMAFELEGFCVVRGPDVLWGGDARTFRPPAGRFVGIIGGPPCQEFSALARLVRANGYTPRFGNLIPEYERIVGEADPEWFVMEEVPKAPIPQVQGFHVHGQLLNNRWLGEEQERTRRISFGTRDGRRLEIETVALESALWCHAVVSSRDPVPVAIGGSGKRKKGARPAAGAPCVVAGGGLGPRQRDIAAPIATVTSSNAGKGRGGTGRSHVGASCAPPTVTNGTAGAYKPGAVTSSDGGSSKRMWRYPLDVACRLQGLPDDWIERYIEHAPFRADAKLAAVANGVPIPMGRAIARAVKRAMYGEEAVA